MSELAESGCLGGPSYSAVFLEIKISSKKEKGNIGSKIYIAAEDMKTLVTLMTKVTRTGTVSTVVGDDVIIWQQSFFPYLVRNF